MLQRFLVSCLRFLGLAAGALFRSPDGQSRLRVRRVLLMLAFLPVLAVAQLIHWLGFLLDEILFRDYRKVRIREPLFVLGVPRSGTTKLHRVLAEDARFTTFRTWECLFALSVTERRFWLGLAALDRHIGRPLGRIVTWLERRVFASLDDVHPMALTDPEEDYFALMPIFSCFILVLPFPFSRHLWRMGRFDDQMPATERERILDFYERCLQKHLYVHGPDKRLLSKNAAFAPLAQSLVARFPDARFIGCLRDPVETVPSQLSSIGPGLAFFGVPADSAVVRERMIDQLAFYYENLAKAFGRLPDSRGAWIPMARMKSGIASTLTAVYAQLELPMTEAFAATLTAEDQRTRSYRSSHRYHLDQFGLDPSQLHRRFTAAYAIPALGRQSRAGAEPGSRQIPVECPIADDLTAQKGKSARAVLSDDTKRAVSC
jgi:hypothetical protein